MYDRDTGRIASGKLKRQKDGSVRFVEAHSDLTRECTMAVASMIADPKGPGAFIEVAGKRYALVLQEVVE